MPSFSLLITVLTIAVVLGVFLNTINYLILLERKLSAWMQDRYGPDRVGPFGLIQPIVDGIKMFLKEDIIPAHVDRLFFLAAPAIAATTALLAFAVVPFGPTQPPLEPVPIVEGRTVEEATADYLAREQAYRATRIHGVIAPGIDIGILFTFSVTSLAVYGIVLGGWSANNKYSLLGGIRSSAQLISYELPLGMSILGVALYAGSLNLERIVSWQAENGWFVFFQPLAFLLFMTGAFAECNRLPFDLPEAEQELVGGYHTEYSSLKFGLFFLGEYAHLITTSFLFAVVFCGGWHLGGITDPTDFTFTGMLLKLLVLCGKAFGFMVFYMLIRWTIPRFRFDQLMSLAWKVLIPLSLLNLLSIMAVREFLPETEYPHSKWLLTLTSLLLLLGSAAIAARPTPPTRRAVRSSTVTVPS